MKKTLALLLSLALIFSALPIMMVSAEEPGKGSLESFIKLSDGAELVASASNSLSSGKVQFTVSLPQDGYVQFDQQLSKLIADNKFDDSRRVYVEVGDKEQDDYICSNFYVQLTANADASSDIIPVNESNVEPGTDAITYHFYGPGNEPGSIYGVNKGSSLLGASQFSLLSTITDHGLPICFTKEESGKLTVSQRFGGQNPDYYANRKCESTHTLSEIGGDEGVYVRLRNGEIGTQTYTVAITSPDVTTAYKDDDVFLSNKDGKLNSFDAAIASGKTTYTYSVTLPGYGYAQLDKKFTDIETGGKLSVNVIPDSGSKDDYKNVRLQVQLANDKHAANDIVPVREMNGEEPGTDGMTWYFWGNADNSVVYNGKGSSTHEDLTNTTNMATNGLGLGFTKNADGTVKGTYILSKNLSSTHTLSEIATDGGVYLRIRNASSLEHTYTVVVTGNCNTYTDGKFKFSDNASKLISSSTYYKNGYMVETATVRLSGNGGYVQLDRKYCDLENGKIISTYLKPGNGEAADYVAMRAQIQLTKDESALTDIVPVVEYQNPTPPTDGMTWLYYGQSDLIYTGTGSNTAGGSCSASPANSAYLESGAIMNLEKTAEGKVNGTYPSFGSCTSKCTLDEIDGSNDGVYLRVRNARSVAVCYTFIFKSTVADIDCDGMASSSDLALICKMILGVNKELTEADLNGDGKVDLLDLVKYKKLLVA